MLNILRAGDRGHTDHGWLDAYHTFSFADYYNAEYMGFRKLKAINEEWIQPLQGFPSHSHKDMEIIFYVIDGLLEHKDSMGNSGVLYPGEIQRITAGSGITHSEHNASERQPVHFFHIWVFPQSQNITPSYQQMSYQDRLVSGELCLLASPDGREDSLVIHQDVSLYACRSYKVQNIEYQIAEQRHLWVQIIRGEITLNGQRLDAGDGAALSAEPILSVTANANSEFLLIDQC